MRRLVGFVSDGGDFHETFHRKQEKNSLGCVLLAGVLFRILGGRLRKDGM